MARLDGAKGKLTTRRKSRVNKKTCAFALILICIVSVTYIFWPRYDVISTKGGAVIVDSLYSSNPQFTDQVTAFLICKGIPVDVYKNENVTVDLYKQLPAHGYNLIVLRVHAGIDHTDPMAPTFLFTDEPYNARGWVEEQLERQVLGGKIDRNNESEQSLFCVGPAFVTISMEGNFNNSVVILDSCYGLYTNQLADALMKKGVKVVVGWDEKVDLTHSDEACSLLLKALIEEKLTVGNAVEKVMSAVGEDKTYNSTLQYYPTGAGNIVLGS